MINSAQFGDEKQAALDGLPALPPAYGWNEKVAGSDMSRLIRAVYALVNSGIPYKLS
jgi:hypothetical protein